MYKEMGKALYMEKLQKIVDKHFSEDNPIKQGYVDSALIAYEAGWNDCLHAMEMQKWSARNAGAEYWKITGNIVVLTAAI